MKTPFVILCFCLWPFLSSARFGWRTENISFSYGSIYYYESGFSHSFELLYEHDRRSCIARDPYYGLAFVGSIGNKIQEYGVKALVNPFRFRIHLSRKFRFYPYIYVQGNWKTRTVETKSATGANMRTGIGLNGGIEPFKALLIKTSLQIGYTFDQEPISEARGLTIELKVGFGVNMSRLKTDKETKQYAPQGTPSFLN